MQVSWITLVLRLRLETGDAAPIVIGVEGQMQADGAPSGSMGVSTPQTKHMRDLGCFSMMFSPADAGSLSAARILALRLALGKPL